MKTPGSGGSNEEKPSVRKKEEEFTQQILIPDDCVKLLLSNTAACYKGCPESGALWACRLIKKTVLYRLTIV